MAEVYILDEYEYFDIRREIEAAETHEELRAAVLKLLECLYEILWSRASKIHRRLKMTYIEEMQAAESYLEKAEELTKVGTLANVARINLLTNQAMAHGVLAIAAAIMEVK